MNLNTLWFILIGVLFIGFFILEGFDYGVGILMPFLGRDDHERRQLINTIGPFWDANEVWLITAGGAMFAAFPDWYATMFSGFYLPLLVIPDLPDRARRRLRVPQQGDAPGLASNLGLGIVRRERTPAFLWGVAMGNLILGVPIDPDMNYVGVWATCCGRTRWPTGHLVSGIHAHRRRLPEPQDHRRPGRARQETGERLWLPTVIVVYLVVGYGYSSPGCSRDSA